MPLASILPPEIADELIVLLRRSKRRSLGIEQLMGTTRHPRHPTEAVRVTGAWVLMAD